MTFGQVVRVMLTKLDWYGTLFPRIPVPIQVIFTTAWTMNSRGLKFLFRKTLMRSLRNASDRCYSERGGLTHDTVESATMIGE